jgi:HEPN domain-containing protein
MPSRALDWLKQAKRDVAHAHQDLKSGFYEWGCFSAQQGAEKAVKALFQHLHAEGWGHSVKKLLESLPETHQASANLIESGADLDKFYIPTRYPNGFDTGTPEDYYSKKDLESAISHAEKIIRFCESKISGR